MAQGCIYSCALASADLEHLYACSVDGKVCVLEDDEATGTRIAASFDTGAVLTQLCLLPGAPSKGLAGLPADLEMKEAYTIGLEILAVWAACANSFCGCVSPAVRCAAGIAGLPRYTCAELL